MTGEAFAEVLGRFIRSVHGEGLELARGWEAVRSGDFGPVAKLWQVALFSVPLGATAPEKEECYEAKAAHDDGDIAVHSLIEESGVRYTRRLVENSHRDG